MFSFMENEYRYYDMMPSVVLAGKKTTIRIRPLYDIAKFVPLEDIEVDIFPDQGDRVEGDVCLYHDELYKPVKPELAMKDGILEITAVFEGEQEHLIRIRQKNFPVLYRNNEVALLEERESAFADKEMYFRMFSCKADLLELRPFIGDLHIHTNHSDGYDDPKYAAAKYRQMGFDFITITDHYAYTPDALERWRNLPNGFKVFPGEEVHLPLQIPGTDSRMGRYVPHIVCFGADRPITVQQLHEPEKYNHEVLERSKSLPCDIPENCRLQVAAAEWAFDKIHEAGGLATFAHPYWHTLICELTEPVINALLERGKFDMMEVRTNGSSPRANDFQTARYYEQCALGRQYAAIGVSDCHSLLDPEFGSGEFATIVWAKDSSLASIKEAIRAKNTVAVQCKEVGKWIPSPFVVGPFRLMRYASYLLRTYFPRHSEYCALDGSLMVESLAGNANADAAMKVLGDRVAEFRTHFFAEID